MSIAAGAPPRRILQLTLAAMLLGCGLSAGELHADTGAGSQNFTIPSASMEPTLRSREQFVARTTDFLPIARGTVYLVRKDGVTYAFRVIGLPGDTIAITGGGVFLNNRAAFYSNPDPAGLTGTCTDGRPLFRRENLPGGESHIVMACNYGFGPDMPAIVVPAGHYFLLGDNRSSAADSRFSGTDLGVGLVPESDFVGKAERIFFSSDSARIGKEID
ncbi:signal peptidase I [Sphingopyxis fribergensis]